MRGRSQINSSATKQTLNWYTTGDANTRCNYVYSFIPEVQEDKHHLAISFHAPLVQKSMRHENSTTPSIPNYKLF